jgi:hypothetical protein
VPALVQNQAGSTDYEYEHDYEYEYEYEKN